MQTCRLSERNQALQFGIVILAKQQPLLDHPVEGVNYLHHIVTE